MTNTEHLDRIEDFIITYACHGPALESLAALRASIAEMERQRNAAVILLRAKTDPATWERYPDSLKAAVEAEYAALTVERDQLDTALGRTETQLALTESALNNLSIKCGERIASLEEVLRKIEGRARATQCRDPQIDGVFAAILGIARAALSAAAEPTPRTDAAGPAPEPRS